MRQGHILGALAICVLSAPAFAGEDPWDSGCEMVGLSSGGSIFQGNCSPHDPKLLTVATDMSGAFITYDAGAKWHTIHFQQLASSNRAAAAFHPTNPKVIYWVRGNELRVTHDQGVHWEPVGKEQPWAKDRGSVVRIWLDPDYPERIFVGMEQKTFLSTDEGQTWRGCDDVPGTLFRVVAERSSPASKRVYWAGTSTGVYRSDDNAATFTKKVQGLPGEKVAGFAGGSNAKGTILYASVPCELKDGKLAGGMFRSKDRGETWECCMTAGLNCETKRSSEFAGSDLPQYGMIACGQMPERAYVCCLGTSFHPPNHSTIYRTDNTGDGWSAVYFSDPRFKNPGAECNVESDWETECWGQREQGAFRGLEVSASNPDEVVDVQGRSIFVTMDAGKTWKSPHRGTFRVDGQGRKHWANSGEVVTSTWNYYADPFDKTRHYICYTDIGFARSLDSGKTWLPELYNMKLPRGWNNTCYELAFDPEVAGRVWGAFSGQHDIPNENAVFRGGNLIRLGGIAVSDDHCEHWKKVNLPVQGPGVSVVVDPKSPKEKRTLYASLFERGVFRSTDGGETWELKNNGLDPDGPKRCLRLTLHKDGTLFVSTTGKGRGVGVGAGLYRSTDKAETWTKLSEGQPWTWIRDYMVKPDDSQTIIVSSSREAPGLYRTTDGGKTWEAIYQNPAQTRFFGATYHPTHKGWIYMTLGEDAKLAGLYLSKDDGKTWTPYTKIPFAGIQRVAFVADDPEHLYLSTFGSSIIKAPVEP